MIKFEKIEHDVESLFPRLVERFTRYPDIDVLYLYGSRVDRRVSPLSDVDLAVLISPAVEKKRMFDLHLQLIGEATEALKTDEADLQVLNRLPVQAQYSILKSKKVLFSRDDIRRLAFESSVVSRFLDFRVFLEEHYREMHQRIRDSEFA